MIQNNLNLKKAFARVLRLSILATMIVVMNGFAAAEVFIVSSASDIENVLPDLDPGDTVVMTDGNWSDQQIEFSGTGIKGAPITLCAQTPGMVVLDGNSTLGISGDWLVVSGLRFEGGSLNSGSIVQFRGDLGHATNSRLTNSAIVDYNPPDPATRYFWVSLYGQHNRVDNNFFQNQDHSGVTVVVWRDTPEPDFHVIDRNHFADRPPGNGNGFETIRLGTSTESESDSFSHVESNLFERVDGEIEIISNKSGGNSFRYNTFSESAGTLTLRHGHGNLVDGNFFLGNGKDATGGVRLIGENQVIVNNYFMETDGRADGAIAVTAGVPNSPLTGYPQVINAVIAHNTIVDVNDAAIVFSQGLGSSGRTLLAENVIIANNVFYSTQDPLFEGQEGADWTWQSNVAFGQSLGPVAGNPGVKVIDPLLARDAGMIWRPQRGSPLVNSSAGGFSRFARLDIDGQERVNAFDIGADESSAGEVTRGVLTGADVGPPLTVSLSTNVVSEADGNSALTVTIVRNKSLSDPLNVTISNSDTSEISIPISLMIPAGQSAATFDVNVIDDNKPDGDQVVTITASATGHPAGSATLTVTDDD
ncbi:MAG: chondroitinase-B domain-containing protein [Planctomycetota bacterium]